MALLEKEAMLWGPKNGNVKCSLCSYRCVIKDSKRGICKVRENRGGKLYTLNYGLVSSAAPDPIEKKPLYHFYPGTSVFSLGTVSCNFRCLHCQNFSISQASIDESMGYLSNYSPERTIELTKHYNCQGIAWTYNEPTIWFEYTYDTSKLAKEEGMYTAYVTNGYMTEEALDKIDPYLDAMNIDVKAFREEFYKEISGAKLGPVLDTVERAVKKDIHVELTYLVIPGKNDSSEEIGDFVDWVAGVSVNIPVHFSRFHPDYQLSDVPATPIESLENARRMGLEKLRYVYTGNVTGHEGEDTYCYNCGELLIKRWGFAVRNLNITHDNKCPKCGVEIHVVR
jgi:pyruvate formate lyase activating enzyme